MTDRAVEGRKLLEGWKAEHSVPAISNGGWCGECLGECPCRTARLIAALEEAMALQAKHCGLEFCEAEDAILAKLAEEKP